MRRLFPALITSLFIPHPLKFASPVRLNFDDPCDICLQVTVKLVARDAADRSFVLHLLLVCIGTATCREWLCQLLPHFFIYFECEDEFLCESANGLIFLFQKL